MAREALKLTHMSCAVNSVESIHYRHSSNEYRLCITREPTAVEKRTEDYACRCLFRSQVKEDQHERKETQYMKNQYKSFKAWEDPTVVKRTATATIA
jgi:hypothetical protein